MINRRFGNFCFGLALVLVGYGWGLRSTSVVHAQDRKEIGHNAIPRSWGHAAAATGNFLVLEDDHGTIHMYNFYTHESMGELERR